MVGNGRPAAIPDAGTEISDRPSASMKSPNPAARAEEGESSVGRLSQGVGVQVSAARITMIASRGVATPTTTRHRASSDRVSRERVGSPLGAPESPE